MRKNVLLKVVKMKNNTWYEIIKVKEDIKYFKKKRPLKKIVRGKKDIE